MPACDAARDRTRLGHALDQYFHWDTPLRLSDLGLAGPADDGAGPDARLSARRAGGDGGIDAVDPVAVYCAVRPPSTGTAQPTMNEDSGEARKRATRAIS